MITSYTSSNRMWSHESETKKYGASYADDTYEIGRSRRKTTKTLRNIP